MRGIEENDIALQIAVAIALEIPGVTEIDGERLSGWRVNFEAIGVDREICENIYRAIVKKHLAAPGTHGKPREMRHTARELILDILTHKKDWKPYAAIFAAFAELNDREFFKALGRGIRKRKKIFDDLERFLIFNWHRWSKAFMANWENPEKELLMTMPGLEYWTDAAIVHLLKNVLRCHHISPKSLQK